MKVMKNLVTYLEQLDDLRQAKGIRHKQTTTLLIMIMAIRCGHTGLNAMARFAQSHRKRLSAATLGIMRNIGFNLLIMAGFNSITQAMAEMEGKIDQLWERVTPSMKKSLVFN